MLIFFAVLAVLGWAAFFWQGMKRQRERVAFRRVADSLATKWQVEHQHWQTETELVTQLIQDCERRDSALATIRTTISRRPPRRRWLAISREVAKLAGA